ncbi:MAG TPA: ABC transporter substrate-binding protein [Methylomirabilota bacterium]|jgi:multiple sugar transport system substrate-binding protein|nr:ABC transporter substrate-binding protein [Methylomirabilota bacterium]
MSSSTRREFITVSLVTAGAAMAPRLAGAQPKSMTVVHESSFIKEFDDFFVKTLAPEYEKLTKIKINYEPVSVGSMLTRLTTIAETKSGPEITATGINWPHLFDASLADLTDVAKEIGQKLGPWHDNIHDSVVVNGKWKALPWGNIGQLEVYRTDWFKAAGINKFPDSWEDLLAAGRLLKKAGHPFGFELGHGFGDNHGWLYPLLWSYGGREVDKDGKTVLIDSSETAAAVDFCRKFYKETMFEDVLGWTDVNNNKAFFGEQISCTNNASSILVVGKRDFPDIAKVTDHALNPQGPKGRFHVFNPQSHALMTHASDPAAAKAFLRWLYDDKQLSRWLVSGDCYYAPFLAKYDSHPMWNNEPRYLPYKESLKTSRLHGWPGPAGHQMSESVAKYVLVDMFAKACRGDSTKDVIATAAAQLKQIYKAK